MEKLIVKFDSKINDKSGSITPIFKYQNNDYTLIDSKDFPNNGKIFVTDGIEKVQESSFYSFAKDGLTHGGSTGIDSINANKSKWVVNYYYAGIEKLLPIEIIPVYQNQFSLKTQKLIDSSNIDSEVFFLETNDYLYGPFKKNYLELSAFNFSSYEDEFENSNQYLDFLESYSDFDGEFILKINQGDISNFLITDSEENLYLTDFKSIIKKEIGEPIVFCNTSNLLDWGKKEIGRHNPHIQTIIDHIDANSLTRNNGIEKLKWTSFKNLLQNEIKEEEIEEIKILLSEKGCLQTDEDSALSKSLVTDLEAELEEKRNEIISLKNKIELINLSISATISNENKLDFKDFPHIEEAIKNPEKLEESLKTKEDNNRLSARKDLLTEDIGNVKQKGK